MCGAGAMLVRGARMVEPQPCFVTRGGARGHEPRKARWALRSSRGCRGCLSPWACLLTDRDTGGGRGATPPRTQGNLLRTTSDRGVCGSFGATGRSTHFRLTRKKSNNNGYAHGVFAPARSHAARAHRPSGRRSTRNAQKRPKRPKVCPSREARAAQRTRCD